MEGSDSFLSTTGTHHTLQPFLSQPSLGQKQKGKTAWPFPSAQDSLRSGRRSPWPVSPPSKKSLGSNVMKQPRCSGSPEPGVDPDPLPTRQRPPNQTLRPSPDLPREEHSVKSKIALTPHFNGHFRGGPRLTYTHPRSDIFLNLTSPPPCLINLFAPLLVKPG